MNTPTPVYLRADGNSQIGLGHVHRLLALSEILNGHFDCKFVIKSPLPGLRSLMLQNCSEVIDVEESQDLSKLSGFLAGEEIVVLDGYHFGTAYQREIKKIGAGLVCVDDINNYHFVADVIINPSGGVDESLYSKESYTALYTGPSYAFLKKPFREAAENSSVTRNSAVLICMGGADPDNHTMAVLKHVLAFPFESYNVVIGEAYLHKDLLLAEMKKSNKPINLLTNLGPQELVAVMRECSTAVCSASGIAYEYSSVGGILYIKQTASNQHLLYNYLLAEGIAHKLEDMLVDTREAKLSREKQKKLFDGNSGHRLLRIFNRLDFNLHVGIRKAQASDLMIVFHWANEPELRRQSFNSASIPLEAHTAWFEKKITDPYTFLYILEYKSTPMAQVRFDVGEKEAVINYSIDDKFRGRGWGKLVLQHGLQRFKKDYTRAVRIVGFVKKGNENSNAIFKSLGFTESEAKEYPNSYKYEYQ